MIDILTTRGDPVVKLLLGLAWLLALVIAITVHEYAHARSALAHGDTTARDAGRVSLNPLRHYDPIGSTLILLFGFGWAKPVPVNPSRMGNPRRDGMLVSLWGPLSNILVALVCAAFLRFVPDLPVLASVALEFVMTLNLLMAFFNLLPVPPLDGSRMIPFLLPERAALRWEMFVAQYGFLLLLAVLWFGNKGVFGFVGGAARAAGDYLTGGK